MFSPLSNLVSPFAPRLAALALAGVLAAGCSSDNTAPEASILFFPVAMVADPAEELLFVVNANSQLEFDSGTVVAVDLDAVEAKIAASASGATPQDCEVEEDIANVFECDESLLLVEGAAVRTGNFAASVGLQALTNGNYRLFVPVRGDPSVTWIDVDPGARTLDCGGDGALPLCDNVHRLETIASEPDSPGLTEEPWGIHVDSGNGYGVVSHLTQGTVTLFDAPADGSEPVLADSLGGLFIQNQGGVRGATGIAGRKPGTPNDLIYVASRAESRIQILTVFRGAGGLPRLAPSEYFFLEGAGPSSDSRALVFAPDGETALVVNRAPPSLQLVDTSIGAAGFPENQVFGAIEICPRPSLAAVADPGEGLRAYVSCFEESRIWVIDPARRTLEAIVPTGRGPNGAVAAVGRGRLYVNNFLEDTITVIDITPGSLTENRALMQIGIERQSEE